MFRGIISAGYLQWIIGNPIDRHFTFSWNSFPPSDGSSVRASSSQFSYSLGCQSDERAFESRVITRYSAPSTPFTSLPKKENMVLLFCFPSISNCIAQSRLSKYPETPQSHGTTSPTRGYQSTPSAHQLKINFRKATQSLIKQLRHLSLSYQD